MLVVFLTGGVNFGVALYGSCLTDNAVLGFASAVGGGAAAGGGSLRPVLLFMGINMEIVLIHLMFERTLTLVFWIVPYIFQAVRGSSAT